MNRQHDLYARILCYPRTIITVLLLLAVFLALKIPALQLDASSDSLVLENDPSLETYKNVSRQYGSTEFLFVTYHPDVNLFSAVVINQVAALKAELEKLQGVKDVLSYLDVPLLYSPKVSIANVSEEVHYLNDGTVDIDLARQEFLHSPLYRELFTSKNQTTTALQINLLPDDALRELRFQCDDLRVIAHKTDTQKQQLADLERQYDKAHAERIKMEKQLVADVRAILDQHRRHAEIFLGGIPMILTDMLSYVLNDMVVFGSVIGLFIIFILYAIFRSPRWIMLPLLSCGITCLYMLGFIAWMDIKLTVISANFVALLLIITLSIIIHLVVSFIELQKKHPALGQFELVIHSMRRMMKPCLYTSLTTMVAFLSLVMSGVRPLIDFGIMMTVAVGLALVISFLLLPAGLLLLPRQIQVNEDKLTQGFTRSFARFTEKNGAVMLWFCALLLLVSIAGITRLKIENRFIDYFAESTEIHQGMLQIDTELGGTLPLDIIINRKPKSLNELAIPIAAPVAGPTASDDADDMFVDDADDFASADPAPQISYWFTRAGMQDVKRLHDYIGQMNAAGKVLSLATFYDVLNDLAGGNIDDMQLALIRQNVSPDIHEKLIRPYLSTDGLQTRIAVRVRETSHSLDRNRMLEDIRQFMTTEMGYGKDDYEITGMLLLYNNMLQSLFSSQIMALGLVFVAIMLMFVMLFESLKVALIAIVPNVLAALFVLGAMGWAGVPLDMMTMTIAAITVGIGVDDTIHYIYRFKKEFGHDRDYVASMYRSHASIGLAMFYTSVLIIAGFSILAFSSFTPSIRFGLLTSVAMFAALLGALSLLPKLLITFKPFGK